jgi:hypothetical protein
MHIPSMKFLEHSKCVLSNSPTTLRTFLSNCLKLYWTSVETIEWSNDLLISPLERLQSMHILTYGLTSQMDGLADSTLEFSDQKQVHTLSNG